MNERIQELAIKARIHMVSEPRLVEFAELIVRECASVAAKNQAEDMGWNISEIIKEHFGIQA